jgi:hypothetical protein
MNIMHEDNDQIFSIKAAAIKSVDVVSNGKLKIRRTVPMLSATPVWVRSIMICIKCLKDD